MNNISLILTWNPNYVGMGIHKKIWKVLMNIKTNFKRLLYYFLLVNSIINYVII